MLLKNKVLIVGQTPPPFGGQAIAIENILLMLSDDPNVFHIRMGFANDMNDIGKFRLKKIFELFRIIFLIYKNQFINKCNILYYPAPGGKKKGPLFKDIIILLFTRFLFKKVVFHFHAGGLKELYEKLDFFSKFFVMISLQNNDLSIILSDRNKEDAVFLRPKSIIVIPYGIKDEYNKNTNYKSSILQLLFVGVVRESKGVMVLLDACLQLKKNNIPFELNIVGKTESEIFEKRIFNFIEQNSLSKEVNICGVKIGREKFEFFKKADIFCFPTFFESETFGLVNLEAMMFEIPVISTDWRGIPDIVENGITGFLCPIRQSELLVEKIIYLYENPDVRIEMGKRGRIKFLDKYTIDIFKINMINAFENC